MLLFMPWWLWMIVIAVILSLFAAVLLWMLYAFIAFVIALLLAYVYYAWRMHATAPERRAEWRALYGIPDTPENDWMCEPCFGRGNFVGGLQCPHCNGTGCRDGIARNLTF